MTFVSIIYYTLYVLEIKKTHPSPRNVTSDVSHIYAGACSTFERRKGNTQLRLRDRGEKTRVSVSLWDDSRAREKGGGGQ